MYYILNLLFLNIVALNYFLSQTSEFNDIIYYVQKIIYNFLIEKIRGSFILGLMLYLLLRYDSRLVQFLFYEY
jgi:hypothetical protein